MTIPYNLAEKLAQFLGKMKWSVEKKRHKSGQNVDQGKFPMSFEVYCLMSDLLICGPNDGKYRIVHYESGFKYTPKVKVCFVYIS